MIADKMVCRLIPNWRKPITTFTTLVIITTTDEFNDIISILAYLDKLNYLYSAFAHGLLQLKVLKV